MILSDSALGPLAKKALIGLVSTSAGVLTVVAAVLWLWLLLLLLLLCYGYCCCAVAAAVLAVV